MSRAQKIWLILLSLFAILLLLIQYGFFAVRVNAIEISVLQLELPLPGARFTFFTATGVFAIIIFVRCKRLLKALRVRYQSAYKSHYRLIEIVSEYVTKRTGRDTEAQPTTSFVPGFLNKPVDCGRYKMRDGTLSPRIMVNLPLAAHLETLWFALKRAIARRTLLIELIPFVFAFWLLYTFVFFT